MKLKILLNLMTSPLTKRVWIIWVVINWIDGVHTGSPASPFLKMNYIELLGGK